MNNLANVLSKKLRDYITSHAKWSPGKYGSNTRLRFLSLALCGEAGELAGWIKKQWRGDKGIKREDIIKELADVGNYVFMIAEELGVDLLDEMERKFAEVEERPVWIAAQKKRNRRK